MLKTHKQRASTRKRKNWTQQRTRRGTVVVTYYTEPTVGSVLNAEIGTQLHEWVESHLDLSVADTPDETAKTPTYAVMVKLISKPRAERLSAKGPGHTTTRKASAEKFASKKDAERAARDAHTFITDVERAWVVTF